MERTFEKPEILRKLEEDLKSDNGGSLNEFWKRVEEKGTPLIEKINDDYDLVTLIYREEKALKNVVLIPPVGMRKLDNCIMDKLEGTDIWYISYKVKNDISFTYNFSCDDPLDNDWNRRWRNVKGDDFNKNFIRYIDKGLGKERKVPYVALENAKKRIYIEKDDKVKEGTIHTHKIYSSILKEDREFHVYTPYEYDKNNKPYETIVLNDGVQFIETLDVQNIFDNLIAKGKISPACGILINSTDERGRDLKCSDKFLDFIVKELMPYIYENYNVSKEASHTVIGGYSLGGLFAAYAGLKHPEFFGNVLSQSGSYWYKEDNYDDSEELWICNEFKKEEKIPLKFYINVGAIEPKISMKDTNVKFKDTLIEKGYEVMFEEFGSGHDYLYWGECLAEGLIFLIGN